MPATELLQKGRYRIDSPVGDSSAHQLFNGYDTTADTKVLVKEIVVRTNRVTTLSQQENMRLAFENAAKRLTEFRHDSLLAVRDFYTEVGRQFLVIEGVDGEDLAAYRAANSEVDTAKVLEWADQLLEAVNYLHTQFPQVIHKRISPGNVRVVHDGRVKLGGISVTDDSGNELSTDLAKSTDAAALNYSPLELIWDSLDAASQKVIVNSYDDRSEKALKDPPDIRSDIYSLGATLYFLLTGKVPVDPLERSIELLEGNSDPLSAPHLVNSQIAPEVSDVVMRALEIKRENRYDAVAIMRQVLRTAVVRVKEREAAENTELREAAETLGIAASPAVVAPAEPIVNEPAVAVESVPAVTGPSEAEVLAQKLREAETLRLEAERRAAEAERLLREREMERQRKEAEAIAAVTPVPVSIPAVEDDLLGLIETSTPPAFVAPAQAVSVLPDEAIHISAKPDPRIRETVLSQTPAPVETASQPVAEARSEVPSEPVTLPEINEAQVEELTVDSTPESLDLGSHISENAAFAAASSYSEDTYAKPKAGLPIPLIAAAAALFLLVAIGGWMFLGGYSGSEASTQTPAEQPAAPVQNESTAVPPAPVTTEPQPDQQLESFTSDANLQAGEERTEASTATVKPQVKATPKPAKTADPAKTPAAKKVTVDDLINDN